MRAFLLMTSSAIPPERDRGGGGRGTGEAGERLPDAIASGDIQPLPGPPLHERHRLPGPREDLLPQRLHAHLHDPVESTGRFVSVVRFDAVVSTSLNRIIFS